MLNQSTPYHKKHVLLLLPVTIATVVGLIIFATNTLFNSPVDSQQSSTLTKTEANTTAEEAFKPEAKPAPLKAADKRETPTLAQTKQAEPPTHNVIATQPPEDIFKMSVSEAANAVQAVETIVFNRADDFFQQEEVDSEWAPSQTQLLLKVIQDHAALSQTSIKSVACRKTQCQIIAFTPQNADADFFSSALYSALDEFKTGDTPMVAAIARQMENGLTSAYIARKGHSLRFFREDYL
ncbi:hypothetical protein TDB9533_02763 [Thalassocella blandensis]|nr:hypothetical protein TDB9533_02763 [Thalassocella blandensis]